MNELAYYLEQIDDCVVCGKPCTKYHRETGQPVHEECDGEYEGQRAEAENDRREALREDR